MSEFESQTILCIDPGKTTGIALLEWAEKDWLRLSQVWQVSDWLEAGRIINYILDDMYVEAIALEDFVITARTAKLTPQPYSLYLIGCTLLSAKRFDVPVSLQTSSRAKAVCSNATLKSLGLLQTTANKHVNDALRHGVLYALMNGYTDKRILGDCDTLSVEL